MVGSRKTITHEKFSKPSWVKSSMIHVHPKISKIMKRRDLVDKEMVINVYVIPKVRNDTL